MSCLRPSPKWKEINSRSLRTDWRATSRIKSWQWRRKWVRDGVHPSVDVLKMPEESLWWSRGSLSACSSSGHVGPAGRWGVAREFPGSLCQVQALSLWHQTSGGWVSEIQRFCSWDATKALCVARERRTTPVSFSVFWVDTVSLILVYQYSMV